MPFQLPDHTFGIRIQQQFVWIEAVPRCRVIRAMRAIAVNLARSRVRQKSVKYLIGILGKFNALQFRFAVLIEQTQFDFRRIGGEHRKIDPNSIPCGAARRWTTFSYPRPPGV
jgi:hypothetical protein